MKTKLKNTVNYLKKNKKKVFIVAGCIIGGVIVFAISKKKPKVFEHLSLDAGNQELSLLECGKTLTFEHLKDDLGIGETTDILKYDGGIELMVDKVPLTDLGNFGEELASKFSLNIDETKAWTLISIGENNN